MSDIDNRELIRALRRRRRVSNDLDPGESMFLAFLFFGAALVLLAHWCGLL